MPTIGRIPTRLMAIWTGSTPVVMTCSSDASMEFSTNFATVTCKDSPAGTEEYLPTTINWSASGTGMFSYDGTNGFEQLFDAWKARTLLPVYISTGVTGDKRYGGSAYVESLSMSSTGTNDVVTFSYQFKGTGEPTKTTIS